MMEYTCITVTI